MSYNTLLLHHSSLVNGGSGTVRRARADDGPAAGQLCQSVPSERVLLVSIPERSA